MTRARATFASLSEGDKECWRHTIAAEEVDAFAALSGDDNPLHMDDAYPGRAASRDASCTGSC